MENKSCQSLYKSVSGIRTLILTGECGRTQKKWTLNVSVIAIFDNFFQNTRKVPKNHATFFIYYTHLNSFFAKVTKQEANLIHLIALIVLTNWRTRY